MSRFRLAGVLALGLLLPFLALAPAGATPRADNPLAGHEWGVYQGGAEMAWAPYENATGKKKRLLAKIALRRDRPARRAVRELRPDLLPADQVRRPADR